MPHKLRKSRKQRGSRYCGWGQVGQHRKGGMKGGKGKAGGRKHFWIKTVKYEPERYRKTGFKSVSMKKNRTINVSELEDFILDKYKEEISTLDDKIFVDLTSLGYGKLLGGGEISIPLKIKVAKHSSSAIEKIVAAGGEIIETQ